MDSKWTNRIITKRAISAFWDDLYNNVYNKYEILSYARKYWYAGMGACYQLSPTVRMLVSSALAMTSVTGKQINRRNRRRVRPTTNWRYKAATKCEDAAKWI